MKNLRKILVVLLLIFLTFGNTYASKLNTMPSTQVIKVNGEVLNQNVRAYNINGNNYFGLRDLAALITYGGKGVNVNYYPERNTAIISLNQGGQAFVNSGSTPPIRQIIPSNTKIYIGDRRLNANAYLINSSNYFKLRDLLSALDVNVVYNPADNSMDIQPGKPYGSDTAQNQPSQPSQPSQPKQPEIITPKPDTKPIESNDEKIKKIHEIVNRERIMKGVPALSPGTWLQEYANLRAKEIATKFSHNRPNGESFSTYIVNNFKTSYVGENIAAGNSTAESTMNQWMNSQGHKNNILKSDYKYLTVGYYYDPNSRYKHHWVQIFSRDNPNDISNLPKPRYEETIPTPKPQPKPNVTPKEDVAMSDEDFIKSVFQIVNQERAKNGLPNLLYADGLQDYASLRANECSQLFSHTRPNGESALNYVMNQGAFYSGENIAAGQRTPEEVMNSWMNSSGHRANILSKNFKYIAIGYYKNYWVQIFSTNNP